MAPVPLVLTPASDPVVLLVQVNVEFAADEVGVKFNAVPLKIVFCSWATVLVMVGTGFT